MRDDLRILRVVRPEHPHRDGCPPSTGIFRFSSTIRRVRRSAGRGGWVAAAIARGVSPGAQPRQPLGGRAEGIHRLFPALQRAVRAAAACSTTRKNATSTCREASTAASTRSSSTGKASGVPWTRSDWRAGDARNVQTLKDELSEGQGAAGLSVHRRPRRRHARAHHRQRRVGRRVRATRTLPLREIHALASEHYEEVRLHLFSDHGMTDTTRDQRDDDGFRAGRVRVRTRLRGGVGFHDGAVLVSGRRRRCAEKITAWLAARSEGSIVSGGETARMGLFFSRTADTASYSTCCTTGRSSRRRS